MKKIFSFMLLCAAVVFAGCSKDDDPATPTIPVEKVTLSKTTLSLIVGETETLTATVFPEELENKEVAWTSNKSSVATVDDKGVVTAKGAGDATITATSVADKTKIATCVVTVKAFPDDKFQNEGKTGIDGSDWEKAYEIASKEQLVLLATRINGNESSNWNGKYYKLIADIDFGADNTDIWTPIGFNYTKPFNGYFDGGNHTIKGKLIAGVSANRFGIFGQISGESEIRNLNFAGIHDTSAATSLYYEGGIVGYIDTNSSVINCSNTASLDSSAGNLGGIAGWVNGSAIACLNTGNINSTDTGGSNPGVGGISGLGYIGSKVWGCINKGMSITSVSRDIGGISGVGDPVACWSNATTISSSGENTRKGGILGGRYDGTANTCYWREISGIGGSGYATITNGASFAGDKPTTEQIKAMNDAWQAAQPNREYQLNATTGEIEKK